MSNAAFYRRQGNMALTLANHTANPAERTKYFEIAEAWFKRADEAEARAGSPAAPKAPEQPSVQQQEQQQPKRDSDDEPA